MRFSIIVPIYNVRKFIKRGMECLDRQTFRDFEVILVDDGSTDGSDELLDELEQIHANVRVFHQTNAGSGPARNLGIEKARGEYIAFFDIDDILHDDALMCVDSKIKESDPDILIFSYCEINLTYKSNNKYIFDNAIYTSNEELRQSYPTKLSGMKFNNGFVWNKVYRRSFIQYNNIVFEPLRIQQDEVFNLSVYPKVKRTMVISEVLYDYYVYYDSNTTSRKIPERLSIYSRVREAFFELCSQWQINDAALTQFIHERYFKNVLRHIDDNIYHQVNTCEQLHRLFDINTVKETAKYLRDKTATRYSFPFAFYIKAAAQNSPRLFIVVHSIDSVWTEVKKQIRRFKCLSRG